VAGFKFKFQKVLDARNAIEKNRKRDLARARNELAALHRERTRIDSELADQRSTFSQERSREKEAVIWKVIQSYLDMLESLKSALNGRMEKKQAEVEQKRHQLMEARRERRAMEILQEKHYQEFLTQENRQEQVFMDEIAQWQSIRKPRDSE
jgi:flagellar FliJ protein